MYQTLRSYKVIFQLLQINLYNPPFTSFIKSRCLQRLIVKNFIDRLSLTIFWVIKHTLVRFTASFDIYFFKKLIIYYIIINPKLRGVSNTVKDYVKCKILLKTIFIVHIK